MQFTDPSTNINFAYVGKRTTGTEAGEYLISGPRWKGAVPEGVMQVFSPNNSVLVFCRTLVESDSDTPGRLRASRNRFDSCAPALERNEDPRNRG